jgi:hypothetical protein
MTAASPLSFTSSIIFLTVSPISDGIPLSRDNISSSCESKI